MISINVVVETRPLYPTCGGFSMNEWFVPVFRRRGSKAPSALGQSVLVHEGGPVLVVERRGDIQAPEGGRKSATWPGG